MNYKKYEAYLSRDLDPFSLRCFSSCQNKVKLVQFFKLNQ